MLLFRLILSPHFAPSIGFRLPALRHDGGATRLVALLRAILTHSASHEADACSMSTLRSELPCRVRG